MKLFVSNAACVDVMAAYSQIEDLQQQISQCQTKIEMIEEAMAIHLSKEPNNEENITPTFKPRMEFYFEKIKTKV